MNFIQPSSGLESYVIDPDEKELRKLVRIINDRIENEPFRFFAPIGKFEEFIDVAMSGKVNTALFEAANGIGKTYGMAMLLANLFWPNDNPFFQAKLFKKWPYPKKGRIVSYPQTVIETIIPTLKAVFPSGRYSVSKYRSTKAGKRYESVWETSTGWQFTIMTNEQDTREFESATLGWFWEDEPISREIHQANYSRLRLGGIGFITETPLKGSAWLYDDYVDKTPSELAKERRGYVHAVLEDACEEHGQRGFIPHQRILDQVSQYDEDEIPARVFGKHHHLTGVIFKSWDKNVHMVAPFVPKSRDFVVVQSYDPHPRVRDMVVWGALDREGNWWIVDELWIEEGTSAIAQRIKSIDNKYRVVKRLIDPSAFNVDKHTGYCLANDLAVNYGLTYEPGSKARTDAVDKIKEAIDYTKDSSGNILIPPRLHVFNTLERLPWEIARWQWQDWRGLTAQFKDPKEKPVDKDDHAIECLGRILMSNVEFTEEESKNPFLFNTPQQAGKTASKYIDPYVI